MAVGLGVHRCVVEWGLSVGCFKFRRPSCTLRKNGDDIHYRLPNHRLPTYLLEPTRRVFVRVPKLRLLESRESPESTRKINN